VGAPPPKTLLALCGWYHNAAEDIRAAGQALIASLQVRGCCLPVVTGCHRKCCPCCSLQYYCVPQPSARWRRCTPLCPLGFVAWARGSRCWLPLNPRIHGVVRRPRRSPCVCSAAAHVAATARFYSALPPAVQCLSRLPSPQEAFGLASEAYAAFEAQTNALLAGDGKRYKGKDLVRRHIDGMLWLNWGGVATRGTARACREVLAGCADRLVAAASSAFNDLSCCCRRMAQTPM